MTRRIVLTLGAPDVARCRFVRSPLFETSQATRALIHPGKQVHQRPWLDTVDRAAARSRLRVLAALNPAHGGWVPDFLAPPPLPDDRDVDEELDQVAAYPPALVAADLRRSLESQPTQRRRVVLEPLIADPGAASARIVAELRWAWTELIAPHWPAVRELLGADVAHRSRQIVRAGLGRMLTDLHPSVTWAGTGIVVDPAFEDTRVDLAGQGLVLMPSAFIWPDVVLVKDPPWPLTLVYPVRGIGDLWTGPPAPVAGLEGVLGRTRALLLTDLAHPATTTALAARHRLSPAAVSAQLGRLRDAGLVTSRRLGKQVLYRRTPLANDLIHADT